VAYSFVRYCPSLDPVRVVQYIAGPPRVMFVIRLNVTLDSVMHFVKVKVKVKLSLCFN
jgi:hypothetical protein